MANVLSLGINDNFPKTPPEEISYRADALRRFALFQVSNYDNLGKGSQSHLQTAHQCPFLKATVGHTHPL
jgi:hypothetical protein